MFARFDVLDFGHKIVEMKLFQVGDDGTLGYVAHTYENTQRISAYGQFLYWRCANHSDFGYTFWICISSYARYDTLFERKFKFE